jgi:hypothetical protein
MAKKIQDSTFIGEAGIAVVQRILMAMRYGWQPTGRFDAGVDGYIELRDTQTKEMLGAHLGAQVKVRLPCFDFGACRVSARPTCETAVWSSSSQAGSP